MNMKKKFLVWLGSGLVLMAVAMADPDWWTNTTIGTNFIDGAATPQNYAPLNLGQLKNVASKAKLYLDTQFRWQGGAGTAVNATVSGFGNTTALNYEPANLGQLKVVAKPFYDRLIALGYNTNANLIARGFPGNWTGNYAWDPSTATSVNYAPANLGQLKMVFSFDLSVNAVSDTDGDGLPDWWEKAYFGGSLSQTGSGDYDSNGLSNKDEYELELDPHVDQAGNMTNHLQYEYDALGRLTNATGLSISGNYTYDAEGNPTHTQ